MPARLQRMVRWGRAGFTFGHVWARDVTVAAAAGMDQLGVVRPAGPCWRDTGRSYDRGDITNRLLLGLKGTISEAEVCT